MILLLPTVDIARHSPPHPNRRAILLEALAQPRESIFSSFDPFRSVLLADRPPLPAGVSSRLVEILPSAISSCGDSVDDDLLIEAKRGLNSVPPLLCEYLRKIVCDRSDLGR